MANFGEGFRAILRSRGLTQAAAAKLLDTTQSVVSYYSNLNRPPRRCTLLNIAERLGVTVGELAGERGAGQKEKRGTIRPPLPSEPPFKQFFYDALQNLKQRWKKKPEERDAVRHLVALLFPDEADRILNWLDQI